MAKFLFLDLVNQYIDDEKKRNKDMRSKSAIYKWIIDDVRDELISINEQYREIDNDDTDAKKVFRDTIIAQFETAHFRKFLKNKSDTKTTHYQNLLYSCFISSETIEDFLEAKRDSNSGTLDFFKAFCQYQEREYGKKTSMPIPIREYPSIPDDIKTETFLIPGATIIDKAFIEKVKSGKTFTMPEFYGAKQNNYCQWYGIIHDYDVERKGYQKLKETLLDSFIEEKDGKVSAIVHGSGGSGKSTVLRRIAVDFHQESFAVIWLERSRVEEFVKSGLLIIKNEIEKNYNRKFLIIIEDWYRMFDDEDKLKLGTKILEITYEMNNVRIVIGDRELKNEYKKYRNNNVELLLSSEDNKEIFERIIEKYPNWEEASERLFTKEKNYESSLFLLLFILARIDNKNAIDLSEPQQVFQNIIESDLRSIPQKYIGLAKALYYWATIYAQYKGAITYKTFLIIGDYFNDNKEISKFFSQWDTKDSKIFDKLKLYITVDNEKFIQFNHDLLADVGLSKINFEDWENYGSEIKLQLFEVISKYGDKESFSNFLSIIILDHYTYDKDVSWLRPYIYQQMDNDWHNGNTSFYVDHQVKMMSSSIPRTIRLEDISFLCYAELLIDKGIENYFYLDSFFDTIKIDECFLTKVLCNEKLDNVNYYAKYKVLQIYITNHVSENRDEQSPPINSFSHFEQIFQDFFDRILKYNDGKSLIFDMLSFSADDILCREKIDPNLFIQSLKFSKNQLLIKDFWNDFFEYENLKNRFFMIEKCIDSQSDEIKQYIFDKILYQDNWKSMNSNFLNDYFMKYAINETKNKLYSKISDGNKPS